jgi:PmbA protein
VTGLQTEDLLAIADGIVARARSGEQVEAYVSRQRATSTRAAGGAVEQIEQATSAGVGVRVVIDGRQGFAYVGSLDTDAIASALDDARDNAAFGTADEANGLAEPDGVEQPTLSLYDEAIASLSIDRRVELALALEAAALRVPGVSSVPISQFADDVMEKAMATTTGLRVVDGKTYCSAVSEALAVDGADRYEAYSSKSALRLDEVDVEMTGREAGDRAAGLIGARKPESRRVTAVFDARAAAAVLGVIGSTLTGDAVLKGRSLFADRVGEQVAVPSLTLVDDPTDARAVSASHVDGEGLASRRTPLIDAGSLRGFLYASWAARKSKATSTASASRSYQSTPSTSARALQLLPGTLTEEELLAAVGDGVYVQSMSGLHSGVNPVSGDFSVGMTGRLVRGGVLAEPVREATIASTIQRMLHDVVALGADIRWFGATGAPLLAIDGIALSGS